MKTATNVAVTTKTIRWQLFK